MASAAANFLSTCGSKRGAPECSTQRSPAATPHVGQGTEHNCSGVSSFFFIRTGYGKTWRKPIQLGALGTSLGTTYLRIRSFQQSVCSVCAPRGVTGVGGCLCFALIRRVFCCLAAFPLGTGMSVLECTSKTSALFIASPPILQTSDELLAKTGGRHIWSDRETRP